MCIRDRPKPSDAVTNITICSDETYTWAVNGQTYNTTQNGLRVAGDNCTADQVLNLTVTPKPSDAVTDVTICSDETYTWTVNGQTYNTTQNGLRIAGDNCTADQVLNLTVTPKPSDAVTDVTICSDETYTWAVNGQTYNTTQNGLRIAGDNCTADQVLNLLVNDRPTVTATGGVITCDASSIMLNATSIAQLVGWTGPDGFTSTSPTPVVTIAGEYIVTVRSSSGCEAEASVSVTTDQTAPSLSVSGDLLTCTNTAVSLTVNSNASSVMWSGPNGYSSTSFNPVVTEIGTYTVTATGTNGCVTTDTYIVRGDTTPPTVSAVGGSLNCTNTSVSLTANTNGSIVGWTGPNGFSSSEASPMVSMAGEYIVTVRSTTGCESSAEATVVDNVEVITLGSQSTDATCGRANGEIQVTVSGGTAPYTYLWSNGASTQNLRELSAGAFTVIVTDANGCTATITETIESIGDDLSVSFVNVNPSSCSLGNIGTALAVPDGGTAPYTYAWSNGQTTGMAIGLDEGTYSVEVTDANGCVVLGSITIDEEDDCRACIGDFAFIDLNRNGIQEAGDVGLENVSVKLLNMEGEIIEEQLTDFDGFYLFDNLRSGQYIVEFGTPENYAVTLPQRGTDEELDSDINMGTGQTPVITLDDNECVSNVDAGFFRTASIGDQVWYDHDCDGIRDANEPGADNVRVELRGEDDEILASTVTNPDGAYSFVNLPPGLYYVSVAAPVGFSFTSANQGDNDDIDSDVDAMGHSDLLTLVSGEFNASVDAGLKSFADLSLRKRVSRSVALAGETVTFTLSVTNEGNFPATGIVVTDYLPNGYVSPSNFSHEGRVNANGDVVWSDITLRSGESISLTFDAIISDEDPMTLDLRNRAEITLLDQEDVDSAPANDDGDQSEDDEDAVEVSISPCSLTLSVSSTASICDSSTGSASVDVQGGVGDVTYSWSNGATTSSISDVAPGTYVVVVTDNEGCSVTADVIVDQSGAMMSIDLDITNETCRGNDGSIAARVTGGQAPYSYTWNTGDNVPTITLLDFGVYVLTVTDANGCSATIEGIVDPAVGCSGSGIDLELIKRVNIETPQPGDTISFQLTIFNESENIATGVEVEDVVPNGFEVIASSIGDGGRLNGNIIRWDDLTIDGLSLMRITFNTVVLPVTEGRVYRNVAQIIRADQDDVDSSPDNDDGDQSEDDEDFADAMPEMSDVALSVTVSDLSPQVGGDITYTVTVSNEGTNQITQVEITDYLPVEYCTNFRNISNSGIFLGDRIVWLELNLASGESIDLTFDATVSGRALGKTVINRVEVTDIAQTDIDSAPDNMDGEPIEDDEASVSFIVGDGIADLELLLDIDKLRVGPNELVEFTITVINHGPDPAFGVTVEDILPDGFTDVTNLTNGGAMAQNRILWTLAEIPVDDMVSLTFNARAVHFLDRESDYKNVAQITGSASGDPDSTPNNDDGDQSEDDEDSVEAELVLDGGVCVAINAQVFLEGPYDVDQGRMTTTLSNLGYLPGQTPSTFFGIATEAGQPYDRSPWFHFGAEGDNFIQEDEVVGLNANYPSTTVDWVLVSLRADASAESTVGTVTGLLQENGEIEFIEGFNICNLDPTEDYYVVIEHRNHLIVMSHIEVPIVNGTITYDFRNRNSFRRILGSGQKEISPGVYCMIAGNGDQDTRAIDSRDINPNDLAQWLIDNGLSSGYFLRDFNLSGDVNVSDKGLFLINNGLFSDVPD